jgi:Nucleotide modification associated domain 3
MQPIEALIINIGSNSNEKNGIAPIYSNGSFQYWPIEETRPGRQTPHFRDLNINCKYPNLLAHYDPRFKPTPTYGDIRDVRAICSLAASAQTGRKPLLLFAATLKYKGNPLSQPLWILDGVGYYIIGFFLVKEIRLASKDGAIEWKNHEHNAHYLRPNHDRGSIKVLVAGDRGSRLLRKPFPISIRPQSALEPTSWLKQNFRELRGGPISGGPWYRRTLRNAPVTTSVTVLQDFVQHEN